MSALPLHTRRVLVTSHRSEMSLAKLCRIAGDRALLFAQLDHAALCRQRLITMNAEARARAMLARAFQGTGEAEAAQ